MMIDDDGDDVGQLERHASNKDGRRACSCAERSARLAPMLQRVQADGERWLLRKQSVARQK
jgi:hypothetical protein